MKKRFQLNLKRAELWVVGSIALFVLGSVLVAFFSGWEDLKDEFSKVGFGFFAVMLLLSLFNYVLRGARWPLFSKKLGVKPPFGRYVLYYISGFSMVTTPGKIGTILRLWLLRKGHGYAYRQTAPLMFMDQLTDGLALLILAVLGMGAFTHTGVSLFLLMGVFIGVFFLFRWPGFIQGCIGWLYLRAGKKKPRLFAGLRRIVVRCTHLFQAPMFAGLTLLSTVGWFAEVLAFYWLLEVLGYPLTLTQCLFVFSFSLLVGALSMLPGGLGSSEATMMALLFAAGVPAQAALAATVLIRLTTLWFSVMLGFIALPFALKKVGNGSALTGVSQHV